MKHYPASPPCPSVWSSRLSFLSCSLWAKKKLLTPLKLLFLCQIQSIKKHYLTPTHTGRQGHLFGEKKLIQTDLLVSFYLFVAISVREKLKCYLVLNDFFSSLSQRCPKITKNQSLTFTMPLIYHIHSICHCPLNPLCLTVWCWIALFMCVLFGGQVWRTQCKNKIKICLIMHDRNGSFEFISVQFNIDADKTTQLSWMRKQHVYP